MRGIQGVESIHLANNNNSMQVLEFSEDLDIMENSKIDIANTPRTLENVAEKVGLTIIQTRQR